MELKLTRPDDWHLRLRSDACRTSRHCEAIRRAIIMPNLRPLVTTTEQALAYRKRILVAVPAGLDFQP